MDRKIDSYEKYDTRNSPFLELRTPFTAWEGVKMALLLVTVLPRLLLLLLSIVVMAVGNSLAAAGCDISKPLPPARRRAVEVCTSVCASTLLRLLGFRIKVTGWENYHAAKKAGPVVACFNHVSYCDAFLMMCLFSPSGVSKASIARLPLLGQACRPMQNILIELEDGKAGNSSGSNGAGGDVTNGGVGGRPSGSQVLKDRCSSTTMPMVAIAPEGTCGDGRCMLRFRRGAFLAGVPVLPVCVTYQSRWHNPAWTIIQEPWHLLRLMCQFDNKIEVQLLPAYAPSEQEKANPALFAENVRQLMAKTLRVPLVEQERTHFVSLCKRRVGVSWDGRRITAPPGIVDDEGYVDLTPVIKKIE